MNDHSAWPRPPSDDVEIDDAPGLTADDQAALAAIRRQIDEEYGGVGEAVPSLATDAPAAVVARPIRRWSSQAVAALRSCHGNVYNRYDEGGFLIWFVPEKPVYIDSWQDPYPPPFVVQAQARDLGVEIDLSSLDAPAPTMPAGAATPPSSADTTGDISFDFELPKESGPTTADADVPPTDIKLDVPEFKPADTTTIDFALDTVSLDLGSTEKKPEAPGTPPHDDHWYDVQTKFDLAKAYQEMGDKEGAREILAEVIKEGDAQQQAEANELLAKLD